MIVHLQMNKVFQIIFKNFSYLQEYNNGFNILLPTLIHSNLVKLRGRCNLQSTFLGRFQTNTESPTSLGGYIILQHFNFRLIFLMQHIYLVQRNVKSASPGLHCEVINHFPLTGLLDRFSVANEMSFLSSY